MESLLDDVDSLLVPGLSTETPEWCSNCQSLRQEMKKLQEEQVQNFGKLKQKIISTDLLIKKYKAKCDDYDFQCKRTEEANKKADKFQRQCEILETQLKAALLDTEPLRKTKTTLEAEIRLKNAEIQSMSDRVVAAEGAQKQYEYLTRASSSDIEKLEAEKRELTAKIRVLESGKLTKAASKEYKCEISSLKKEKAAMLKNEKRLESKLSSALAKIEHLTNVLKEKKMSPRRRTRVPSGSRLSPMKSPGRSPRSDNKASPGTRGRARTISERSSSSQCRDGTTAPDIEKLASDSESSSDDTDDTGSVCSVAWTFSPLMKCISPLPPSPACFKERKLKREQSMDVEEESEVSDIADELEQQLLQDDQPEETLKNEDTEVNNLESMEDREQSADKTEPTVEDNKITVDHTTGETDIEIKNSMRDVKADDERSDRLDEKEKLEETCVKEETMDTKTLVIEKCALKPLVKENNETKLPIKEKLAQAVEIVSPASAKKRIAHKPDNTNVVKSINPNENKAGDQDHSEDLLRTVNDKGKTPPIRRSARIKSLKEGEMSDSEKETNELKLDQTESLKAKNEKSELNRNNTEEFTPIVTEKKETLLGSEMGVEVDNTPKGVSKSNQGTCDDIAAAEDTSSAKADVSSLDFSGIHEINTAEKHLEETVASSFDTKLCKSEKNVKGSPMEIDNVGSDDIKSTNDDRLIEIWKEDQKDVVSQVNVPKSCLQRQNGVSEEPSKLYKDIESLKVKAGNKDVDNQVKRKFGPDKFIAFQKSSSEILSNESEDFSYVDDYKVVTRDDKELKLSPKIELKTSVRKNMKRKIRKRCKYRDLDSECYREKAENVFGNSTAGTFSQLANMPIEKDDTMESSQITIKNDDSLSLPEAKLKNTDSEVVCEQKQKLDDLEIKTDLQNSKLMSGEIIEIKSRHLSMEGEKSEIKHGKNLEKDLCKVSGIVDTSEDAENAGENVCDLNERRKVGMKSENSNDSLKESQHHLGDTKNLTSKDDSDTLYVKSELENSNVSNNVEKTTPSRQMSTGFVVNTPTLERTSSTESSVSFRNSPSRLFQLESGICDTIVEEDISEEIDKTDKSSHIENESKNNSDISVIFGVEDLLDVGIEMDSESTQCQKENAQNDVKPFCDKNANVDISEMRGQHKLTNDSSGLFMAAFEEDHKKPGCSYHYQESGFNSTSHEVALITGAVRSDSDKGRTFSSSEDEKSLSRSSTPSFTSINRATPVSPLSISPFNFLNPVSPLPPSPVKDIDRVSPLSPEHLTVEQKSELIEETPEVVDEPPVFEDIKLDNATGEVQDFKGLDRSEENVGVEEQKSSVNNDNILGTVPKVVDKKEKCAESAKTSKKQNVKSITCDTKTNSKKKSKKSTNAANDAPFNVDDLELFPLPHMISPVKTPKAQSKVKSKVEQMKTLEKAKQDTEASHKINIKSDVEKENLSKPKQFLTKAPDTALTVKPRLTGNIGSLEISNQDIFQRKSSRTALKRVGVISKVDETAAKKISVDGKGAFEEKSKTGVINSSTKNLKENLDTKTDVSTDSTMKKDYSDELLNNDCLADRVDIKGDNGGINGNRENDMVFGKGDNEKVDGKRDNNAMNRKRDNSIIDEKGDNHIGGMGDNSGVDGKGDTKVAEVCHDGQDNLAFKKKTRVAHKPKIPPLKVNKIQIIDAPRLPPLTGRKRKSLDKVTKETLDKKPCKENTSMEQKPIPVAANINQEDKKKMQVFLKSAEPPETFVARVSTERGRDGVYNQLVNTCLECLGRVCIDTLDVVYRTCLNGQHSTLTSQFPFLSDVDKKSVQLIQYLVSDKKADYTALMRKIWDCVFSQSVAGSVVGKMAQCRVFIALCSIQGDLELARALFYRLVTCGHLNYIMLIVAVVSVWPDVLRRDPTDRPDKVLSHGMTLVFEEIITNMLLSQKSEPNDKILFILKKMCNWSGTSGNGSSVLKVLCNRLMTIFEEESLDKSAQTELIKALQLLCTRQSWEWTKEHFIMRHGLQTVANKYLAQRILKPVSPNYLCAILQLTSRCLNSLSSTVKSRDYQLIINKWLLPILSHKPGNDQVRRCCLETLLELSPLYSLCMDSLQKWFMENNDIVSAELTAKLEDLRLQFKQKLGLQCRPFIRT